MFESLGRGILVPFKRVVVLSEEQKIDPIVINSIQMTEETVEKIIPTKRRKRKLSDEILALEK